VLEKKAQKPKILIKKPEEIVDESEDGDSSASAGVDVLSVISLTSNNKSQLSFVEEKSNLGPM